MSKQWFVLDRQGLNIDSVWASFSEASAAATTAAKERGLKAKVTTQPQIGALFLDPQDAASWKPKRGNPSTKNPEDVYRMWHQKEPNNIVVRRAGCDFDDDDMVCIGKAHNIVYRSGKWQTGKKTNDYVHHFDSKPRVWMLASIVDDSDVDVVGSPITVRKLLASCVVDGRVNVAELATPLSFGLDDGTTAGNDIAIHSGAKVYGGVDQKTVIIHDPVFKLVVVKGGKMHFDERGIIL